MSKKKRMVNLKKTKIPETPQYQEINSDTEVEFISKGIGFEDVVEFENVNEGEEMNRKTRNKRDHNEKIVDSRENNNKINIIKKGEEEMKNNNAAMNNNDVKEEYITISKDELKQLIEEEVRKEINKKDELPKPQVEIIDEADEDELMELSLDLGAEDFIAEEVGYEILTAPEDFNEVRDGLEAKGYKFLAADVKLIPQTTSVLEEEGQIKSLEKLLDVLEEDDDVQNVHHNWEMPEA